MKIFPTAKLRFIIVIILSAISAFSVLSVPASAAIADGQLWEETNLADKYWDNRGISNCNEFLPTISDLPSKDFNGWSYGNCDLTIDLTLIRASRRYIESSEGDLITECETVIHEAGHAQGLYHSDADKYPVMQREYTDTSTPKVCYKWAHKEIKERRQNANQQ